MSVGTAGEKGEEAVAGGADGAKYTNGEECDAEVSRGESEATLLRPSSELCSLSLTDDVG